MEAGQRLHILVINADNGSKTNGRRTQRLKRLEALSDDHQVKISWHASRHTTAITILLNTGS